MELIVSPLYENLNKEIIQLKTKLSNDAIALDDLKYVICANIEMKYMLEVGNLEYKLYKYECDYRRLKRKIELIQSKINRQEIVDIDIIENILDIEFIEYQEKLDAKLDELKWAKERSNSKELSVSEKIELKNIYHKIVKKLHPDINKDITDQELELYQNAVKAYHSGDLQGIKVIYHLLDQEEIDYKQSNSLDELEKIKNDLINSIDQIDIEMNHIKSIFPYTAKELLQNRDELNKLKEQYQKDSLTYINSIEELKKQLDELLISQKEDLWEA